MASGVRAAADVPEPQENSAAKLARITPELLPMRADRSMDVAYLGRADTVFTHLGSGNAADYEIGSIGKTFTAELFADAVARGELRTDTRLGELLLLDDGFLAAPPGREVTDRALCERDDRLRM
ncbi:serine hydrolase [Nocardia sp. SYP-A9097]|nr:serine hydrolase [Nocardia sp. SYP-A9097]